MPHNVEDVIGDIESVKDDLHDRIENDLERVMNNVLLAAKTNVESDADYTGNLTKSLRITTEDRGTEIEVSVGTDAGIAPYAPFVEFGMGGRTNRVSPKAPSVPAPATSVPGFNAPPSYPFDAPDLSGDLVADIIDWVDDKPVHSDQFDEPEELGKVIAATMAEEGVYAHPFLRPAWFKHEETVKKSLKVSVAGAFV